MCSSPAFDFKLTRNSTITECTVDTGCTAEAICSQKFAKKNGLQILPSHIKKARLADGNQQMDILGSTTLEGEILGNKIVFEALIANGGDDVLLGMPGAERNGLRWRSNTYNRTFKVYSDILYFQ